MVRHGNFPAEGIGGRSKLIYHDRGKALTLVGNTREALMIVTTGNEIEGYAVTGYLGIVRGIVVRSPNIAQGLLGGLK